MSGNVVRDRLLFFSYLDALGACCRRVSRRDELRVHSAVNIPAVFVFLLVLYTNASVSAVLNDGATHWRNGDRALEAVGPQRDQEAQLLVSRDSGPVARTKETVVSALVRGRSVCRDVKSQAVQCTEAERERICLR